MKKIFSVAAVITVMILTGCVSEGVYKNEEYKFTLEYGNEWKIGPAGPDEVCRLDYAAYTKDDGSSIGHIEVMARKSQEGETLDNAAQYYLSLVKDGEVTYSGAKLDGLDGYWITVKELPEYTAKEDLESDSEEALIVTKNEENVYAFRIYGENAEYFSEIENKADAVLASFKVTEG
ncbi:MAG: hypothetical protein IJ583_16935 [Firmicutes bacterium]|nr:hypothetical protein [Bacillota bacterium]